MKSFLAQFEVYSKKLRWPNLRTILSSLLTFIKLWKYILKTNIQVLVLDPNSSRSRFASGKKEPKNYWPTLTTFFLSFQLVSDFKSKQRWTRLFLAITLVLMTDILNTTNNAVIKGLHLNSIDVLLVRSIIQAVVLGVVIIWQGLVFLPMDKRKDWWKSFFALISAGISGTAVVLLCYYR